jgi:hypothetical protein
MVDNSLKGWDKYSGSEKARARKLLHADLIRRMRVREELVLKAKTSLEAGLYGPWFKSAIRAEVVRREIELIREIIATDQAFHRKAMANLNLEH